MSICYDLRFPELYRIMALAGATVVAVPAAFTAATGPPHWELLLRARAVENQVFVIGAGQVGDLPPGMPRCHGHSMIVDPWGDVLAERTEPTPRRRRRRPRPRQPPAVRARAAGPGESSARRVPLAGWTAAGMTANGRQSRPCLAGQVADGPPASDTRDRRLPTRSACSNHDGVRLYYEVHGHGPRVLVFMHGILMDSNMNRRLAADLAARGNRVVLLDLPGHGLSDKPATGVASTGWTPTPHHVVALLDHLASTRRSSAGCRSAGT